MKSFNLRQYPLFRIIIAFVIGIIMEPYLPWSPNLLFSFGFISLILTIASYIYGLKNLRYRNLFFYLSTLVFFFSGALSSFNHQIENHVQYFGHLLEPQSVIIGEVVSSQKKSNFYNLLVVVDSIKNGDKLYKDLTGKLLVKTRDNNWEAGMEIQINGRINTIPAKKHDLDFNYQEFMRRKGILFQSFNPQISLIRNHKPSVIRRWRSYYLSIIQSSKVENDCKAIMKAMLAGDKSDLGEISDIFRLTGTSHVLAISGLHVGIIAFLASFLCRLFNKKYTFLSPIVVTCSVWIFCLLSGAGPSTVRACTMVTAFSIGWIFKKKSNGLNLAFLAALIMLLFDSNQLYDIGFQFSFLALLGILLFYQMIYKMMVFRGLSDKLWQMTVLSISAQIFILPLSIYYFHSFPIYFIFASWVAVPMTFLLVGSGISLVAIGHFNINFELIHQISEYLVNILLRVLHFFAELPAATIDQLWPSLSEVLSYYLLLAMGLWFVYSRSRKSVAAIITSIILLLLANMMSLDNKELRVLKVYNHYNTWVLDVIENGDIVRFHEEDARLSRFKFYTDNIESYYKIANRETIPLRNAYNHLLEIQDLKVLIYNGNPIIEDNVDLIIINNENLAYLPQAKVQSINFTKNTIPNTIHQSEYTLNF